MDIATLRQNHNKKYIYTTEFSSLGERARRAYVLHEHITLAGA
jgi:hypothetical protein